MSFKFRLETNLHLAEQKRKAIEGILAQQIRTLKKIEKQKKTQAGLLAQALAGQKNACLTNPKNLDSWQKYSQEQYEKLLQLENELQKKLEVVEASKQKLFQCRIEEEKFKKLKEKQLRIYMWEELKKEQNVIDEIAQGRTGINGDISRDRLEGTK